MPPQGLLKGMVTALVYHNMPPVSRPPEYSGMVGMFHATGPYIFMKIFVTFVKSSNLAPFSVSIDPRTGFLFRKLLKLTCNNEEN